MDLETENRIAAILMKEAAELRRQAEKEGVRAYLEKPNVRFRPNSRFLTATVLGVQQANKAVEVNEMWNLRNKELELDDKIKRRSREESSSCSSERRVGSLNERHASRIDENINDSPSARRRESDGRNSRKEDVEGLRDEELEEFLQSRAKRGRGSVGSRMDETGPYLHACPDASTTQSTNAVTRVDRVLLGPERPRSLRPSDSSSSEQEEFCEHVRKKPKKDHKERSKKKHKHRSKDKRRDDRKKTRKEEKKRKRH